MPVKENDEIKLFKNTLTLKVAEVPGHTLDHIIYFGDGMLFCGDTLFSFGCGRVFEGSFEQMFSSLEKLKKLDRNYNVYCTHEYTLDNLKFLINYFKDNERFKKIYKKLSQRSITLPSKLKGELELNPFLNSNFEEFKQLRIAKNQY